MNRKFISPLIFFLLFILSLKISIVKSQPNNPQYNTFNPNYDNRNPNFSPNNPHNPNNDNRNPNFSPLSADNDSNNNNNNLYTNPKFSPTVAIIVVILVAALFFMGYFSIYIRQCSDANNLGRGNSVRNGFAFAQRDRTACGRRGLEASVIETFPTFSYSEVREHKIGKGALECAVCLNEFEDDEKLRLIPKCDHVFHPECIDAWLENHVTCPVCRSNLTPQDGDEPYRLPELNQENNDVAIQVDMEEEQAEVKPEVNRVWSFKYSNRPPRRTESLKGGGRNMLGLGKFRSHSTGHLIQPDENVDRFTLRLPEELRKEMMNRALLNRAKTVAVHLPRDESSTARRWFRTGLGEGSMKSISSLPKVNEPDRAARSDRWLFFTRKVSMKSTKVVAENGEASTSTIETTQSFKNKEPKNIDEKSLLRTEPVQPSV